MHGQPHIRFTIFRSLRLIVDLFYVLYCSVCDVCWYYGVVRLGWCGILMQAEAQLLMCYFM